MARQLLKHIDILATMEDVPDDAGTICGRELKDAAIIIGENVILSVGPTSERQMTLKIVMRFMIYPAI